MNVISELAAEYEKLLKPMAKERQREHGGTAPGRQKTLVPNSAQVIDNSKTRDQAAKIAGIGHDTLAKAKKIQEIATPGQKEERDQRIIDLYLQCWTQEQVADEVGMSRPYVNKVVSRIRKCESVTTPPDSFKHYDVWNFATCDKDYGQDYPGRIPELCSTLSEEGWTGQQIADELGWDRTLVVRYMAIREKLHPIAWDMARWGVPTNGDAGTDENPEVVTPRCANWHGWLESHFRSLLKHLPYTNGDRAVMRAQMKAIRNSSILALINCVAARVLQKAHGGAMPDMAKGPSR
jgi:biotin operon repressor